MAQRNRTRSNWAMAKQKQQLPSLTSADVARRLGITANRVLKIARARNVGRKVGRDWLFTESEVESLRPGPPGNPNFKPKG